ncbi:hypothetical protein AB0D24_29445 [Streptomyces javensis]|uniref:hypothetical protein n=1 Tax=Streptomyces javensis TaxID=114698 RepID=UPI0033C64DFC
MYEADLIDTARALARMRERRDVLTVGGELLAVGDTERHIADDLPPAATSGYAERSWLPGTVASCRLEFLPHTAVSGLPLVHGLVDASHPRLLGRGRGGRSERRPAASARPHRDTPPTPQYQCEILFSPG